MKVKNSKTQSIIGISLSVIFALVVTIFAFSIINTNENIKRNDERAMVLQRFLSFHSIAEIEIYDNVNLLKGYLTYIQINPEISEDETLTYLKQMLKEKETLIRNISIIKDTTITWVYPKEGNEKAIGTDLEKIDTQRDAIIEVKNSLNKKFIGPINLIQGGQGFIARIPIVIDDLYWGQISVVLDADQYIANLKYLANDIDLNVAIYNKNSFPNAPFLGDSGIKDREGIELEVEMLNSKWIVVIEPQGGWQETSGALNYLRFLTIAITIILAFLFYMMISTRFLLRNRESKDILCGICNRNYLHDYYFDNEKKRLKKDHEIIVYVVDINNFMNINNTYGQKIGDAILIEFAQKLEALPIEDFKVFRIGGDEFIVMVTGYHTDKEIGILRNVIESMVLFDYEINDKKIKISASVGYGIYPRNGESLDLVVKVANEYMLKEKNADD